MFSKRYCDGTCVQQVKDSHSFGYEAKEFQRYYTYDDLKEAFEESRLTHPMVGFKHDTFNDYLKWRNKKEKD